MKKILLLLLACVFGYRANGQTFFQSYSFALPSNDTTDRRFLPGFPAYTIGESRRISADTLGNFLSGAEPFRFWGVNLVASGAFPDKSKASYIAARMRKMGINLVRFHHIDNPNWAGNEGTLFYQGQSTRSLNLSNLDKLEYLIAKMKQNGVYVNMNLNVSRTFNALDGVVYADSLGEFGKAVTVFDPRLVFLQREYAQQLLSHVNPYTGLALKDDPVLAMVEIINENSLYGAWKDGWLTPFKNGGRITRRHSLMLDSLFQDFLLAKYGSQDTLAAAWSPASQGGSSSNLLINSGFENSSVAPWGLELFSGAQAQVSVSPTAYSGTQSARVQVTQTTGTDWHIQFLQAGMSVQKDSSYVLTFYARSDANRTLNIGMMRNNDPYTWYGGASVGLTTQWQRFTLSLTAPENNNGQFRLTFSFNNQTGSFWLDEMRLGRPAASGLEAGEALATRNIRRIPHSERLLYSPQRIADMAEFYTSLQQNFMEEMRLYLKNTLGVQAPVTGTNALTGIHEAMEHEHMDYLDDHSYWDHPWFPSVAWDPNDWLISNESMLEAEDGGAITQAFTGLTYVNKPYTVSEYNHAFPNRSRTEMVPALSAYASFHGADGLMFFDYNGENQWDADRVGGFFSIHRDHSIMALFPSCAYAYRNHLIREGQPLSIAYNREQTYRRAQQDNLGRWGKYLPYDRRLNLTHAIKTLGYQSDTGTDMSTLPTPAADFFVTETGQTSWNQDLGLLYTHTPGYVSVAGNLQPLNLEGFHLQSASGDGVVTWVSLEGDSLITASRSLLTLSTRQQNTGMVWDGLQTLHSNWGTAPTQQLPIQLSLRVRVQADTLRLYPLDKTGLESTYRSYLPVAPNTFDLQINQATDKSMWFGVEARGAGVALGVEELPVFGATLSPNPASDEVWLAFELASAAQVQIEVMDLRGSLVLSQPAQVFAAGYQHQRLGLQGLTAGFYLCRISAGGKSEVLSLQVK
ncbi:MAG: T9SS C-terminal target domain-containing protein [Bacteroidetes bacterium]|nr:MAG: T9SS C-terminal target domain-containing protein [Bacteroidota bacterium]